MKSIAELGLKHKYVCKIHHTPVTIKKVGMFLQCYCNKCQSIVIGEIIKDR